MKLSLLGSSGVLVSGLCLGTMTFGWQADLETGRGILDAFIEAGGNFLATANVQSEGKSEGIIGSWLKDQDRSEVVLATYVVVKKESTASGSGADGIGYDSFNDKMYVPGSGTDKLYVES